ncbi:hypothetical protein HY572_01345 [Candidatus Micrarchaeota archaeon]|nr:hypothetical protein [Candidatus Micrarchaeota archaeon]
MKRFLSAVFLAGLVAAHDEAGEAVASCAGPVLWELSIPFWQFALLALAASIGFVFMVHSLAKRKTALAALGFLLAVSASGYYLTTPGFNWETGFFEENQHVHADIKVYVQGQAVNFSEYRFQSSVEQPLTEFIHFHDGNANIVHLHASGVALSYLFKTFGGFLNQTCLQVAAGEPMHCAQNPSHTLKLGPDTLKFYLNNQSVSDLSAYPFKDLDQILISFGPSGADVSQEIASVTAEACIPSKKCEPPEGYDVHAETCGA